MKKTFIALAALAFGTLALGIAEFVMMAILQFVASDFGITEAQAGYLISAYALGVCAGAPVLLFFRRFPLKNLLIALACIMLIGNTGAMLSPNFSTMLLFRFISGFPHGAYFGVASIVADKLAPPGKGTLAVAIMISGMTIANLIGVPLGTVLCSFWSWRIAFMLVAGVSALLILFIKFLVPPVENLTDTGFWGQFHFLKHSRPWLLIGATMFGNGGIFCMYSYISLILTETAHFPKSSLTLLMAVAGSGMVIGNLSAGKLSERFKPGYIAAAFQLLAACMLFLLSIAAQQPIIAVLGMTLCTMCLFGVSSPQQFLLLKNAPGGELLGAISAQIAFNLGNAFGAYLGGIPLKHGFPPTACAAVGIPLTLTGFTLLMLFNRVTKKTQP